MRLIYGSSGNGECPELVWGKKVSCEFRKRVVQISKRLECDPNHLMTAMALETGGKFDPKIKNSKGYVGLIQFGDDAVTDINQNFFIYKGKITKSYLTSLSAEDQLYYVEYFLHRKKGKLKTLADFYLAILLPYDVGKGNEKNHVVFDSSLTLNYYPNGKVKKDLTWVRNKGYKANPTFFKEEGEDGKSDGKTYVWEVEQAINEWYKKGKIHTNTTSDCTCVGKDCSCGKDCIDLSNKVTWISQFNKSERKNGVVKTDGCWRTSQKLLINSGLRKEAGMRTNLIQVIIENTNAKTVTPDNTKAQQGVNYIDSELEKGNPVLVGTHYKFGYEGNTDNTTDHYIVIIGRGCENDKRFFRFYEVGTSYPEKGQSLKNKLYLEDNFLLKGTGQHNTSHKYIVSQVRKN